MGRINSNRFYCTRSASSPSQSSLRDASSPKVGALGSPRKLHLFAKASPFGRGVTVGDGEGEPAEIIRSCRMPLRPLPVKKVAQKRPQAFLSNKSKILFPLQRRRPPPVAETGRSCWGSGQQDASAAQGTMRMLGAATRKKRRTFPIVLLKTPPCRGRRRFRPAAPQCAAAGCTLPHARCGWVHRS